MTSKPVSGARVRTAISLAGALTGAVYGGLCASLVAEPDGAVLRVLAVSGAAFLGVLAAYLMGRWIGRRLHAIVGAALVCAGGISTPLLPELGGLALVGPALAGFGTGLLGIITPLLARELAANSRHMVAGTVGALMPVGIGGTQLVAVTAVALQVPLDRFVWPTVAVLGLVVIIAFVPLPESPVWLAVHGRMEDSYAALVRLFGTLEASIELDWVIMARDLAAEERRLRWRDLKLPGLTRTVIAGAVLAFVREAPLGLAAMVLVPVLVGDAGTDRSSTLALLVLGVMGLVLGAVTVYRPLRTHAFARIMMGIAVAVTALSLMVLATSVAGGTAALVIVLVAATLLAAAQFVMVTPAARGSVEPLVPPWLVRDHTVSTHIMAAGARALCLFLPTALIATRGAYTTAVAATIAELVLLLVLTVALPQTMRRIS